MAVATVLSAVLSIAVVGVAPLLVALPVFGTIRYGVEALEGVVPVPAATVLVAAIAATCLVTVEWSLRTVRRARARSAPAGALAQGTVELASYVLLLASIVVLLAAVPYLQEVLPELVFAIGVLVGFFYLLTAAYAWAAHEWVRSRNEDDERTAGGNWLVLGVFVVGYLSVAWWRGFVVVIVAAVLAVALGAVFAPDRLERVRDAVERRAAEQEESEPVDPDEVYGITDEVRRLGGRLERVPDPRPAVLAGTGTVVGAVVYWAATVGSTDAVAVGFAALAALVLVGAHVGGVVRNEFTGDAAVLREFEGRLESVTRGDGAAIVDGGNEVDGSGGAATTARPALESIVARLAGQADLPAPEIRLLDERAPVALTVGYRPASSTLVCSRGLLETLDDRELEAVLAHELAHVANRDAAVLTALSVPGAVAGLSRSRYGYNPVVEPFAQLVRIVSHASVAFVARGREYAADDGAIAITGDPAGLASALETLDAELEIRPAADLRERDPATAFSIVPPPWEEHRFFDRTRRFVARGVLGTHPSTTDRIDRIRSIVSERS
ncbi:M48 family metallopeptidase [Natronobeatus ordinarius]|uniref:M48 family metallopeptidase n=1 Tax=Natronobeatus ordinarius TaxID=2963433 RepID=UPI0020CC48AD|nr:M48 family metallopeptidase [Natronobeatus ordinarius]